MPTLFIAPALLHLISEGRLFKLAFSWLLKFWSAAVVVVGIWTSIEMWRAGNSSSQAVFGQIVFQAALLLATYLTAHLSWLRAQDVAAMPQTAGEVIIPLARLLLRLGGEIYACLLAVLGTGGALMIWISAGEAHMDTPELRQILPGFGDAAPFHAGLVVLLCGLGGAALGLLAGYLASELLGLLCAIESNTRKGAGA
jgi:hypothetical protein